MKYNNLGVLLRTGLLVTLLRRGFLLFWQPKLFERYVYTWRFVGYDSYSGVCEILLTPPFVFVKFKSYIKMRLIYACSLDSIRQNTNRTRQIVACKRILKKNGYRLHWPFVTARFTSGSRKCTFKASEGSKSSTHYLSDKNRFDVSSKGPSSGHTNSHVLKLLSKHIYS